MKFFIVLITTLIFAGCSPKTPKELMGEAIIEKEKGNQESAQNLLVKSANKNYLPAVTLLLAWHDARYTNLQNSQFVEMKQKITSVNSEEYVKTLHEVADIFKQVSSSEDKKEYVDWLRKAAQKGSLHAASLVGQHYITYFPKGSQGHKHGLEVLTESIVRSNGDLNPDDFLKSAFLILSSTIDYPSNESSFYSPLIRKTNDSLEKLLKDERYAFTVKETKVSVIFSGKNYELNQLSDFNELANLGVSGAGMFYIGANIKASNSLIKEDKETAGIVRNNIIKNLQKSVAKMEGASDFESTLRARHSKILIRKIQDNCSNSREECPLALVYGS